MGPQSPLWSFQGDRLQFWGLVWLVWAAGWVAACRWIDGDARRVFQRSLVWRGGLAATGVLFFLGTYQFGWNALPGLLCLVPFAITFYLVVRETVATSEQRLMPVHAIEGVVRMGTRALGLDPWLARLRRQEAPHAAASGAVTLLKKDGAPYDSTGSQGIDREASRAVQSVQGIVARAIATGATDIHLEPKVGGETQLRYRIDGLLQSIAVLPADLGRAVVSTMKVLGDMDIAERRRPQDGTFTVIHGSRRFEVRAASGPTNFGEKMSLRLLDPSGGMVRAGLDALGMRPSMLATLRTVIHRSHGMLLVCGPTGSGKTTTVYAGLGEIDLLTRNIVTIEDPIEYRLDNISQTAVNVAADLTFAAILRSVLRQDPDVILVGEIRDKETAEIAMQAALTGHFVFSTIHANDAATTVTRLLDIGIETNLVQSAVTAVLAQRLVRLLCGICRKAYRPTDAELKRYGMPADKVRVLYRAIGCPECNGSGYRGRTGVYELIVIDAEIRRLLVGSPSVESIRDAARKAGSRSLRRAAIVKVAQGLTSIEEVDRVVPDEADAS